MNTWKEHKRARTYVWAKEIMSCRFCDLNYIQSGKPGYCQQYGYRYDDDGELTSHEQTSESLAEKCKTFVPDIMRISEILGMKSLRTMIEKYDDGGERWYEKDSMG